MSIDSSGMISNVGKTKVEMEAIVTTSIPASIQTPSQVIDVNRTPAELPANKPEKQREYTSTESNPALATISNLCKIDPVRDIEKQRETARAYVKDKSLAQEVKKHREQEKCQYLVWQAQDQLQRAEIGKFADAPDAVPEEDFSVFPPDMIGAAQAILHETNFPLHTGVAACLIATIASQMGNYAVEIDDRGWKELLVLNILQVAPSGARKSAVNDRLRLPFADFQKRKQDEHLKDGAFAKYRSEEKSKLTNKLLSKHREEAINTICEDELDMGTFAEAVERIAAIKSRLIGHSGETRSIPQILADSGSLQRFAKTMSEQNGALAIIEPEGDFCMDTLARPRAGAMELFLKGNTGEPYAYVSNKSGSILIQTPALNVHFFVQHQVLDALVRNREFVGRGGLARINVLFASDTGQMRHANTDDYNNHMDLFNNKIKRRLERNFNRSAVREVKFITLTEGAYRGRLPAYKRL